MGADAVIMMGITGTPDEAHSLATMGKIIARCDDWGIPLVAEMLPGGFTAKEVTLYQLIISARLGADLGADIVKMRYQGTAESYRAVASACYVPLVVLGGSRQSPEDLLQEIRQSQIAGARGVAVGRNLWQADKPGQVLSQIVKAVHKK